MNAPCCALLLGVCLAALPVWPVCAQEEEGASSGRPARETTARDTAMLDYGSSYGAKVVLTNSGFGAGAYLSRSLGGDESSFVVEVHVVSGKDERETAFFNRFGQRDIPDKANYLLIAPVRIGIQRRLFRSSIEDNFRPYLHVAFGPTAGWVYPYFEDANGDGERAEDERAYGTFAALPEGEVRFGAGGLIAVGAYFGEGRATRSLRFGYAFDIFQEPVQLLEPSVKGPQRFFGTPTIMLTIGRLF